MSEVLLWKLGGAALVVYGLKLIFFGGYKQTGDSFVDDDDSSGFKLIVIFIFIFIYIYNFIFGTGEREPMGIVERWFGGLVFIAIGAFILTHAGRG